MNNSKNPRQISPRVDAVTASARLGLRSGSAIRSTAERKVRISKTVKNSRPRGQGGTMLRNSINSNEL
jgi:hypothetical protein